MKISDKEREIIELLSEGKSVKEIAPLVLMCKAKLKRTIKNTCEKIGLPTKSIALVGWYYKKYSQKSQQPGSE